MAKRAAIATKTAKTKAGKKPVRKKPGTPIDDTAVLAKLATALRRSPDLAVAAALRKIGIKDQASLRRIAGKYAKEKAAAKRRAAAARRKKSRLRKSATAQMAAQPLLSETPAIKRSATGQGNPGKKSANQTGPAAKPVAKTAKPAGTASPLQPWVNTGLDLSTAAFTTQLQLYSQMMKMAPVKTMVKQQMEFNQAMVSLFKMPLTGFLNGSSKKPKTK